MSRYSLIKEAAKRKNVSINKLESDLGLPKGSISKYDTNVPGIDKIAKIANYLDVSIDSITPEKIVIEQLDNEVELAKKIARLSAYDKAIVEMLLERTDETTK